MVERPHVTQRPAADEGGRMIGEWRKSSRSQGVSNCVELMVVTPNGTK